jgi:hypothetical protein
MENTEKPASTDAPVTQSRDRWWIRLIRYPKRKMDERAAKKQKETSTDRAARVTADATKWIAIFTFVSVAVSVGAFLILRSQLKEMHDGGVDTHTLAEQAVNQNILLRQQIVGTQAAVLKSSTNFTIGGFALNLSNIRDVAAADIHVKIVMTPISLPQGLPRGVPETYDATEQRIEKDNGFCSTVAHSLAYTKRNARWMAGQPNRKG